MTGQLPTNACSPGVGARKPGARKPGSPGPGSQEARGQEARGQVSRWAGGPAPGVTKGTHFGTSKNMKKI